ncbi:ATP-dependent metallopeptidase FtsH/Yme1/Tma family protein [Anabaena sp. UHCC 0399]|nr:ATP-dependent metallopeptidase FtsH/Yme1/Tma family protein [Anabaena sp. UHCC 0399]MEA5569213.1 ATP-dependent metallopeptidase FtsH/Yme1/Tma family protein [Anabaena sp. UHCC 0399]
MSNTIVSPPRQNSPAKSKHPSVFSSPYIAGASIITLIGVIGFGVAFFDKQPQSRETWRYSQFIQEVQKGRVEKVSLSADRSTALVTPKYEPSKKLVTLVNDPDLINTLTSKGVDISVLPQTSILPSFNRHISRDSLTYGNLIQKINQDQIKRVEINEAQKIANVYLKGQKPDTPPIKVRLLDQNQELIQRLRENNIDFGGVQ